MQFIDLAAQQQRIRQSLEARIQAVMEHGKFIMGQEVTELEEQLAAYVSARHCISCSSGTDALFMTLMAWGVKPGDAVFVPVFSFFATAEVVALLGATPVMVDIDPLAFNMDPQALQKAIAAVRAQDPALYPLPAVARTEKLTPRAIIPVDLFGQAADYDAILAIAKAGGLAVLEDAAQSFGASYEGKKTCGLGCDAAATSFFPNKPLGCYGDGGAVFTNDDALAEILRSIRVHGKGQGKYDNIRIGINARLDTMQAAILLAKLEIFPSEIAARQQVAQLYAARLADIDGLRTPTVLPGRKSVWAQYCITVEHGKRDAVRAFLQDRDIPSMVYYPTPMHMLGAFSGAGYKPEDMPNALAASRSILALPFHPYMTEEQVATVAKAVKEALAA